MKVPYAVFLWTLALLVFLSLFSYDPMDVGYNTTHPNDPPSNSVGIVGAWGAFGLLFAFGFSAYLVAFILVVLGVRTLRGPGGEGRISRIARNACTIPMLLSLACLLNISISDRLLFAARRANIVGGGGLAGEMLGGRYVLPYLGYYGSVVACAGVLIVSGLLFFRFNPFRYSAVLIGAVFSSLRRSARRSTEVARQKRRPVPLGTRKVKVKPFERPRRRRKKVKFVVPQARGREEELFPPAAPERPRARPKKKPAPPRKPRPARRAGAYRLPGCELLHDSVSPKGRQLAESLQKNVEVLQSTLKEFGIEAEVGNVIRGPVITRYEVHPAPGVKVQKITALADDLALAMAASSIRIVAPIPGKSVVGIEIPNREASLVCLKEMLDSREYSRMKKKIPLAIGKEISGRAVITDLTRMPHLLIAGATGSGKTVCVNSMILTMLFALGPEELKLLLIDPKRVEMTQFRELPHLIAPVITDAKSAARALKWATREMDRRYELFSVNLVRNIESYNSKIKQKPSAAVGASAGPSEPLPYLAIIIDELADLILLARKEIEDPVIRLAQMGRAAGLHIILATQRPSVNVITGLIKANFPTRIAFKVASRVDSKVVLDTIGAEKLLGRGDMIFIPPGTSRKLRIQGTLVEDDEIEAVVGFVKEQASPDYREDVFAAGEETGPSYEDLDDELYEEAVRIVTQLGQASASMLQRRMRIGYTRAARLVDMMEERGVVGPAQGSKPREILGRNPK